MKPTADWTHWAIEHKCTTEHFVKAIQADAHRAGVLDGLRRAEIICRRPFPPVSSGNEAAGLIRDQVAALEKEGK